ncbi:MAG: flagellar hook-basal body complex protein [Calditerrivibrio sp.]|uniref:flagellar hook-basal body complex protein n=1 Tax=Calditerrivibrio sp. TaxID=2792612 RepID=UPI003D1098BC
MIPGLFYALSAISAGNKKYGVTANNISNISSTAFKGKIAHLKEFSKGGVELYSVTSNEGIGYFINTGRILDLAINGDGYFKLTEGDKEVYSRLGIFSIDKNGEMVDVSGRKVGINVGTSSDNVQIDNKGNVYVDGEVKGKLQIYNQNGGVIPDNNYEILSGFLEASNVDIAKEMVESITNFRYIQASVKTTKTVDEMLGNIVNIVG